MKENKNVFNQSYYKGIEQAIAYLRFGFDHVALWHVFDRIPPDRFVDYKWKAWDLLRKLKIDLDFTPLIYDENENTLRPYKKGNKNKNFILREDLKDIPLPMDWKYPNKYIKTKEGRKFRVLIDELMIFYFNNQ